MVDYAKLANEFDATAPMDYGSLVGDFEQSNKSVGERALGALPLASDYMEGFNRGIGRSTTRMSEAASDIGKSGMGPANVGNMALGGLEYLASPFEGAGSYIGNPIRRSLGGLTSVGGVDLAEIAANTAELAPMMMAPIPGAKTAEALAAGGTAVMGEAPAAMSAMKNAIPYLRSFLPGAKAVEQAVSTPKSDMLPGQTISTSHKPFPTGWYERQFRGGGESPDIPPLETPESRTVLGPKTAVGTKGSMQTVLSENYRNLGERPTLRTGHVPRMSEPQADEGYFNQAMSEGMQGVGPSTDLPIGGVPSNISYMHLPQIRENTQLNPALEQEIKDNYFRKQQTTPMRQQTGGGEPWGLQREPVTDPLDEMYANFFRGGSENPGGGGTPSFPVGPRPSGPDASNDNLENIYQGFFRDRNRPALSSPYRQSPMEGAEPLPSAPEPTPTPLPKEKQMRGANSALDDPTVTDLTKSNPDLYYNWNDKDPNLYGKPPMELPPVSPPSGPAKNVSDLTNKIRNFKGGPVGELPPLPMRAPEPTAPAAADFGAHKVGDEVDVVHKINGQEMRAPGGRIVELISKHEPVFTKAARGPNGEMPNRISHENRGYAKLEDGREIPIAMVQPFKPTDTLSEPKTRITSKAVKPTKLGFSDPNKINKAEDFLKPSGEAKPYEPLTDEYKRLAQEMIQAREALMANTTGDTNKRFVDALNALHVYEMEQKLASAPAKPNSKSPWKNKVEPTPAEQTAADRALKKHMEAQAKAPYTATPDIPKKRKNGKTSAEDAAKQSAAAKAQNKEKNPSSMVKKKDEE